MLFSMAFLQEPHQETASSQRSRPFRGGGKKMAKVYANKHAARRCSVASGGTCGMSASGFGALDERTEQTMPEIRIEKPAAVSKRSAVSEEMLRASAKRYVDGIRGYYRENKGESPDYTFNMKKKEMQFLILMACCFGESRKISRQLCFPSGAKASRRFGA